MGSCCSCFDAIRGGKHGNATDGGDKSTEMTSRNSASGVPPPTHGMSMAMSAPTIRIQGFNVSGSGLALARIPIEQDAAYWEWHVNLPGLPRAPSEDDELEDVQMNHGEDEDPNAIKFGVATRKDRNFYRLLESVEDEGDDELDDGTALMRPISNLRHKDVIGVAVQQSDLPMIQFLLNGEPLPECTINRFRGQVYPAVYIPPGASESDRVEDEGISLVVEFDEDRFKEMSPHARKPNTMHFRAESDMNMIPLAYPAKDMDSETENPNCKHRLDRWELVKSIIHHSLNSQSQRTKGGSLANIVLHLPDITKTDASALRRAIGLELGEEIAEEYGKRLHQAFVRNGEIYKTLDAWANVSPPSKIVVDARYIISTYKAAISAGTAFHNPRRLLFALLSDYVLDSEVASRWHLEDVLGVISIASISDEDRLCTAGMLRESVLRHSKTKGGLVTLELLSDALTPTILDSFRAQVLGKMTNTQRLDILAVEEDVSLRSFISQSKKIGLKRMIHYRHRRMRKMFFFWRLEGFLSRRMKRRVKRQFVRAWREETRSSRLSAFYETLSSILHKKSLTHRLFRKWRLFWLRAKKIKRCFVSDEQKQIISGFGFVRRCIARVSIRQAIALWLEFVRCSQNEDKAISWNDRKVLRRYFSLYRKRAEQQIELRRSGRYATMQLGNIEAYLGNINAEKARARFVERVEHRRTMLMIDKDKANIVHDAVRRRTMFQKQVDDDLVSWQKNRSKLRLKSHMRSLNDLFESKWATKQNEALATGEEEIKRWVASEEFTDLCTKKEKEMLRAISLGSGVRTDQEKTISNPSIIAYSILDGHLAGAKICADEFLHCFATDTINFDQFQVALDTCKVALSIKQRLEIFNGLSPISSESQNQKVVLLKDLNKYRQLSNEYIAPEGAPWKMYVCSSKQELLFHCVVTNEKIFESEINKKHIKQIVRENSLSFEMKFRRDIFREKCKARQLMFQHYRAKQIQNIFRRWKSRRRVQRGWTVLDPILYQLSLEDCVAISITDDLVLEWSTIKMI